ncbi:MAG TPA: DUF433 domain-containing protein [Candidatus Acidoferrales bacterium]|nr:DUF433 domain-containing protein [Candidatus Acidoferrales bacterium]
MNSLADLPRRGFGISADPERREPAPWPAETSARTLVLVDYSRIITIEPGKRGGKPCIRGLRITVSDVLDYLASGMTEDEILRDFPDLTREDIRASLAFAADRERGVVFVAPK